MSLVGAEGISVVRDARITPFSAKGRRFYGAVYDQDRMLVPSSLRESRYAKFKHGDPVTCPEIRFHPLPSSGSGKTRQTVFLGHMHFHFGHFLLETASQCWVFDHFPASSVRLLALPFSPDPAFKVPAEFPQESVFTQVFAAFGFNVDAVELVTRATAAGTVVVPQRRFTINHACDPSLRSVYARIRKHCVDSGGVNHAPSGLVYLSRRQLPRGRQADRDPRRIEAHIEERFRRLGFEVLHPEAIPFIDQVATMASAKTIAGFAGSAMHLALFMQPGGTSIIIRPRYSPNMELCNELAGVETRIVDITNGELPARTLERLDCALAGGLA